MNGTQTRTSRLGEGCYRQAPHNLIDLILHGSSEAEQGTEIKIPPPNSAQPLTPTTVHSGMNRVTVRVTPSPETALQDGTVTGPTFYLFI